MRIAFGILFVLALPVSAAASTVNVTVVDATGQPLTDAVVSVTSSATPAGTRPSFPWPMVVTQKDVAFNPYVLLVPVGATVSFPNRDRVRHHVYSFSKPKRFELELYGRDESRSITFDVPGTVALGCNIHDRMSAFVRIVDTPWAAKTGTDGRVSIGGVPGGNATITVWHPRAQAKNGEFAAATSIPATGVVTKTVTIRTYGKR